MSNTVESIGNSAFMDCKGLKSITIPKTVTSISDELFKNCKNLTSITIPKTIKSIGNYAFDGTKWLENKRKKNPLVIVNGILIDGFACKGKVNIPSTVKSIGDGAFKNCSLTKINIPKSLEKCGELLQFVLSAQIGAVH